VYTSESNIQLPWLDPQFIESITVLNSLSATHKYGTLGRNGVIVIRTKTSGYDKALAEKPSALVKGNNYNESVKLIESGSNTGLKKQLQAAQSFAEAKTIFERETKKGDMLGVDYYFTASDYFKRWNKDYAMSLLGKVGDMAYNNTKALRALAFKYEENQEYNKAREVYQRIVQLKPGEAQAYIDLARSYKNTGKYQEALNLFKRMMINKIKDTDFTGLANTIENEIQHILAFHRTRVDYYDLPNDLRSANFKRDVRVVCEWNDPYAEFELQFVNPGKKFFTWNNTKLLNTQRMLSGIKNGFAHEEFIIDDAETGKWTINLKSLSEEADINPTYLKYTVYKNYGLPQETKSVKVVKLTQHQEKVTLDAFDYGQKKSPQTEALQTN
ncbi:MAG: tetratricopeptide repeat protein, partial [Flavobacteriaceae bacterium]|nr:tetratricopeptide repeat protein [Flavobacteriaceae bacterium]